MNEQLLLELRHDDDQVKVGRVLELIRRHRGRAAAVSIEEIARQLEVNYRDVQAVKKFLVEERREPIGTAWSKPYGYYLVTGERELERNFYQFMQRGVSNIKHARAYATPQLRAEIVGQLDLLVMTVTPVMERLSRGA